MDDLKRVARRALAAGGGVLTAGERAITEQIAGLSGGAGRAWARLQGRSSPIFRPARIAWEDVPDLPAALSSLEAEGWIHGGLPWDLRLPRYTVPELKAACARLGLPSNGRRGELVMRLTGRSGWADDPVYRVAHRGLLRRLELLAFARPWTGREAILLERIGVWRWPRYTLTPRASLFERRADLLALEEALRAAAALDRGALKGLGPEALSGWPEVAMGRAAARAPRPAWLRRLDPQRYEARVAAAGARALERAGEHGRAEAIYRGLLECGAEEPGPIAQRLALVREALGDPADGAAICAAWRGRVSLSSSLALERTGRRLAKKSRSGWAPAAPLRAAPRRRVWLAPASAERGRPRWGEPPLPVEPAVQRALGARGSLYAENTLWTTLFGLCLSELYWLPVPGMLPTPQMSAPLDLGTPAFATHREDALAAALSAIRGGGAPARIREAWAAREGERIRGIAWGLYAPAALTAAASGVGGEALAQILEILAREGWRAARGLPDLAVLPGEEIQLDAAPGRVPPGFLLAEIKGPGDSLRDEQRAWIHRLLGAGVPVEVWEVRARNPEGG